MLKAKTQTADQRQAQEQLAEGKHSKTATPG